jgi:four helix bundle protein
MEGKTYIKLGDLEVYKLARELSKAGWEIYEALNWQDKKIIGDQFIRATDSFGANITEGYSRYHYLDKIKFYYNSRASLAEAKDYWLELLYERKKVDQVKYKKFADFGVKARVKLQNLITALYQTKNNNKFP